MKTGNIVIAAFLLLTFSGFAQLDLNYDWTKTLTPNFTFGTFTPFSLSDGAGNIYTSGSFQGTSDFDPGAGTFNITASGNADGFLQKLNSNGNFIWAVNWSCSGTYITSDVEVTNTGETVVAGYFSGTIDCDPGPGVVSYTSAGMNNPILMKFDVSGNLLWSKHLACSSNSFSPRVYVNHANDDVFIHGFFQVSLVPNQSNPGLVYTSAGGADGYAVQFSSSGVFINSFQIGGTGSDNVHDIAVDNSGNILLLGNFSGTVDFDPSPSVSSLTATLVDGFIAKYNNLGQFVQTIHIQGTGTNGLTKLKKFNTNGWLLTGTLVSGTVDLDPGAGVSNFNNSDVTAIFFAELDANFNYLSGGGFNGGTNVIVDLFQTTNGRVYLNGHFKYTVDFDPGIAVSNLTSSNGSSVFDEFTVLLNPDLTYNSSQLSPLTTNNVNGYGSASFKLNGGKVIKSGAFNATIDFDPSPAVDNHSSVGVIDYYTSVLSLCSTPVYSSISETSCATYTAPSGQVLTSSGVFNDTIISYQGCDSIITINLTIIQPLTPTATIVATSDSICQGTQVTFSANLSNEGSSPSYEWFLNGSQISTGSTFSTFTLANNDEVYLVITSNASCISTNTVISDTIKMVVGNPGANSTISISESSNFICTGDQVTFTASITNGGNYPSYYWELNGVQIGSNSDQLTLSTLADGDQVFCSLVSSDGCLLSTQAGSNVIDMTVYPVATPQVAIAGPSIICIGDNATYSSTSSGAGSNPMYNWYVNSNTTSIGVGPNLTTNSLNDGDTLICVLVNNDPCAAVNFDISNSIIVSVLSNVTPTIMIASNDLTTCAGDLVEFTATYSGEGSFPGFQWYANGSILVGEINATLSSNSLTNQDAITCVLASSLSCASTSTTTSNSVSITINPLPGNGIVRNDFILSATQAGASYQWIDCGNNNQAIPGANGQNYTVTANSQYAVIVTQGSCSDTSSCELIANVGLDALDASIISIAPNPTNGLVHIASSTTMQKLNIYNSMGSLVLSETIENNSHLIDLSSLENGMYLIEVQTQEGQVVKRIIKEN